MSGQIRRYFLTSSRIASATVVVADGDARRRYRLWIEEWPNGWAAQEVSDTGSGGIIAEGLASRLDAVDAVIDFLERHGGTAVIEDEN